MFHLAAQPLVRLSYEKPVETIETNVMGTVNILEASKVLKKRCSVVCITTDKCYENKEILRPYKENDSMGGYDPYSCSKGCAELLISAYRRSFFGTPDSLVWVASARAGNVVGGGDWMKDRIVPDCMRALSRGLAIPVRNKVSTRPWQHVLDALGGYLTLGAELAKRERFDEVCGGFNFGPDSNANRTVKDLVEEILRHVKGEWIDESDPDAAHEARLLSLDIRKAKRILGWKPKWGFEKTIEETVKWYENVRRGENPMTVTRNQIMEYSK